MVRPWYEEGLNFACTGCGACCSGRSGVVWLSQDDIDAMCVALELGEAEFLNAYTRVELGESKRVLRDRNSQGDCVFLHDRQCRVYEARPLQCRTFPWWPSTLENVRAWADTAHGCEGIQREAPLVPFEEISGELRIELEGRAARLVCSRAESRNSKNPVDELKSPVDGVNHGEDA